MTVHTGSAETALANDHGFERGLLPAPGSDDSMLVDEAPVSKTVGTHVRGPSPTSQQPLACWSNHAGAPFGCVAGVARGIENVAMSVPARGFNVTFMSLPAIVTEYDETGGPCNCCSGLNAEPDRRPAPKTPTTRVLRMYAASPPADGQFGFEAVQDADVILWNSIGPAVGIPATTTGADASLPSR